MKEIYIIEYNGQFVAWYESLKECLEDIQYIDSNGNELKALHLIRLEKTHE